jgi:hypothetical protein
MTSPTQAFFDDLARRGHVSWLEHEQGRLRFELVDGECVQQWTVAFDDGDVEVSRGESDADGVLRAERELFDRTVTGEEKLLPATLRGEISMDGSLELLAQFSRLLPGPADQVGPRVVGTGRRRTG